MVNAKCSGSEGVAQWPCELGKLLGPGHIVGNDPYGIASFHELRHAYHLLENMRERACSGRANPKRTEKVAGAGQLSYRFLAIQARRAQLLFPRACVGLEILHLCFHCLYSQSCIDPLLSSMVQLYRSCKLYMKLYSSVFTTLEAKQNRLRSSFSSGLHGG